MKTPIIASLALCAFLCSSARSQAPMAQPLTTEQQIEVLQEEIDALKAEVTALKAQVNTTGPVVAPTPVSTPVTSAPALTTRAATTDDILDLMRNMNKMPKEFQVVDSDTSAIALTKLKKRDAWISSNFVVGKVVSITFRIQDVESSGVVLGSVSIPPSYNQISQFMGKFMDVKCTLSAAFQPKVLSLKKGEIIAVEGRLDTDFKGFNGHLDLSNCTVKQINELKLSNAAGDATIMPVATAGPTTEPTTTHPAPARVSDLLDLVNKMPEEFLPANGDTALTYSAKKQNKMAWIQSNVVGKTVRISFTVINVTPGGVVVGSLSVPLLHTTRISCTLSETSQAKASELKSGDMVTIEGTAAPSFIEIRTLELSDCTIK